MLTVTQKTLVQGSFATIAPIADDAAALFYRRLFELDPSLKQMFRGHEHYDTVGAALLWTLEKGLGAAFTPEMKEAWATVYGLLATTMQQAAREALAAA